MQNDSQARKVPNASRLRLTATFCLPLDTHLSLEGSALVANSKGLHVDCPFSPGDLPGAATAQLCAIDRQWRLSSGRTSSLVWKRRGIQVDKRSQGPESIAWL